MYYSQMNKYEKEKFNSYELNKYFKDQVLKDKLNVMLNVNGYSLYDKDNNLVYTLSLNANGMYNTKVAIKVKGDYVIIMKRYVDYGNKVNTLHFFNGLINLFDNSKHYYFNLFDTFKLSGNINDVIAKIKRNMKEIIIEFEKIQNKDNELTLQSATILEKYIRECAKEYNIKDLPVECISLINDLRMNLITIDECKIRFESEILTKFKQGQEELIKCDKFIKQMKNTKLYNFISELDKNKIYALLNKVKLCEIDYEGFRKEFEKIIRLWESRLLVSKYYKKDEDMPEELKELIESYCVGDLEKEDFQIETIELLRKIVG